MFFFGWCTGWEKEWAGAGDRREKLVRARSFGDHLTKHRDMIAWHLPLAMPSHRGPECAPESQPGCVQVLLSSEPTVCVTSGKLLSLLGPHFSHRKNGEDRQTHLTGVVVRVKRVSA